MANVEAENIKRSRDAEITKVINDASLTTEEKVAAILKIYKETSAELAKHVNYQTRLVDLMVRYKDNATAGALALDDMKSKMDEQAKAIEYQISLYDEKNKHDKEEIAHLKQVKKDLETQRDLVEDQYNLKFEGMKEEEQRYVLLMQADRDREAAAKQAIEANKQEARLLQDDLKKLSTGSKEYDEKKRRLDQINSDNDILSGRINQKNDDMSKVLGATGSKMLGAIGSAIDSFKAVNADDPEDMIVKAINRSKLGQKVDTDKQEEDKEKNKKDPSEYFDAMVNAIKSIGNVLDQYVTSAANFVAQNQGAMNAALYGYGGRAQNYYEDYFKKASVLTGSALMQQTTYLQSIRTLAQQGIAEGGDVAALLTAVSEKTVPQFSATSGYLRRLVLLQEKDATQKFFGLESILQKSLNSQFGESSYLNQLFDSVNQNLQDAMANLANSQKLGQSYQFTATVQSWLSSLYEQGVDANTVTRISNVINALGSGNISAMSSDAGMQKLTLLAMDRIGTDYASVLQNGLDSTQVSNLLHSMVSYLKDIATQTNNNNVLESAYSNLFGISMTDMYAFRNLRNNVPVIDVGNTGTEALTEVNNRLTLLGDESYTSYAEQIDNVISNLQFSFGNNVVTRNNGTNYLGWKSGKLALDLGGALDDLPMVKVAGKAIEGIGVALMLGSALGPAIDMVKGVKDTVSAALGEGNSVTALYQAIAGSSSGGGETSSTKSTFKSVSDAVTNANTSASANEAYTITEQDVTDEFEKDSPELTILKEFEQTLMENKEGKKAFAVSLMGMSDEVLKSFASIFADEDSMTDVFKSNDAKNKLFNYGDDTSDKTTSGTKDDKKTNPQGNSNVQTGSKSQKK